MILASIIIPTKNGDKYLDEILKAIYSQTIKNIEVIIIDSGSTDNTLEIIKKYPIKLKQIPSAKFNHGGTRNLGAKMAKGKYLVYLTQDATPANKDWLDNLLMPLETNPMIVGTYARHIPRKTCNPILARQIKYVWPNGLKQPILKTYSLYQKYQSKLDAIINFSDSSSAIKRDILDYFPFPKTNFAEDMQWEIRVLKAGYHIRYTPESTILHSHDYSLLEQIRQNYDHQKAIKKIFPSKNTTKRLFHIFNPFKMVHIIASDIAYILTTKQYNFLHKMKWILYSPIWHFAVYTGTTFGIVSEKLPSFFTSNLSRQERIKRQ